ncbi:MAG: hypothetical protein QOH50_2996 [Kribbellaceae bacterium]|jgi:hypothetical protein|nr:hypothetical protein [Kribbellaceae bacterium]
MSDLFLSGANVSLPWSTVAQVEPLARLEDIFDSSDLKPLPAAS